MYRMYTQLQALRRLSKCADKQVACIITDVEDNILSVGVNRVFNCVDCTKTGSKVGCLVSHAEEAALANLARTYEAKRAYLTLYPCENCQRVLDPVVDEIIVFGKQHKNCVIDPNKIILVPDLSKELWGTNGEQKQLSVITSELAELIKVITDFFYRRNERATKIEEVLDEIVDVELMTAVLLDLISARYDESVLFELAKIKEAKLGKIKRRLADGTIKRDSPYS